MIHVTAPSGVTSPSHVTTTRFIFDEILTLKKTIDEELTSKS